MAISEPLLSLEKKAPRYASVVADAFSGRPLTPKAATPNTSRLARDVQCGAST